MTAARRRSWAKGLAAETAAALWLMLKGYRVLGRRVRGAPGSGAGEIDLIARRGRTLAFVEVKTRPDLDEAAFAIGPEQRRRIARGRGLSRRPAGFERAKCPFRCRSSRPGAAAPPLAGRVVGRLSSLK